MVHPQQKFKECIERKFFFPTGLEKAFQNSLDFIAIIFKLACILDIWCQITRFTTLITHSMIALYDNVS